MIHPQRLRQRRGVPRRRREPGQPAGARHVAPLLQRQQPGRHPRRRATAVAPDFTRASLGVPAMNYSVLLHRSIDFDLYSLILDPAYPDPLTQQLALSMIQMLWDRSDPNGYAHRMTDRPLAEHAGARGADERRVRRPPGDRPGRPTSRRARSAPRSTSRSSTTGRWPGVDVAWGIPQDRGLPVHGLGDRLLGQRPDAPEPERPGAAARHRPAAADNTPNRSGEDPHGEPRLAPAEMQMVSDFLRPERAEPDHRHLQRPLLRGRLHGPLSHATPGRLKRAGTALSVPRLPCIASTPGRSAAPVAVRLPMQCLGRWRSG